MPNEMMPHQMMRHNHAKALHDKISKKAPIDGIWIGDPEDRKTWGIHFKNNATDEQKTEAALEIQNYDELPTIVEDECKRASEKIGNLINEHYSPLHQTALTSMRLEAKVKGKKAAEDLLDPVWNWTKNALALYYQKEAEIIAIAQDTGKTKKDKIKDIETLVDNIDLSALEESDPKIKLKDALTLLES